MGGPLDGVRIVDLTAIISGPLATQILADQGADVIKVEPPAVGDLTRHMGTNRSGVTAIFAGANRNKRSVVIDLATKAGLELFRRLAADADVVAQNFRPGAADRMGVGYDSLRSLNPDLIYVSISGFGPSGPHSRRRVYDPLIQAASGMAVVQGEREGGLRPELVRSIVCDKATALTASQAITAALFARERGAGGQHVELCMLDAAIAFHWSDLMWRVSFIGDGVSATDELADMFRVSSTRDGHVVVVAGSDSEFEGACKAFRRQELLEDPRFATLMDRMHHVDDLWGWLESEFSRFTSDELCALLDEHHVPCAKVNDLYDLVDDAQVEHNGSIVEVDHPAGGAMRQAKHPAVFSKTEVHRAGLAPGLGEHTDEVLAEIGIGPDERASLRQEGVVG